MPSVPQATWEANYVANIRRKHKPGCLESGSASMKIGPGVQRDCEREVRIVRMRGQAGLQTMKEGVSVMANARRRDL
eukprot:scaffold92113_cov33-Tisochrysis_lutea.AAC.2